MPRLPELQLLQPNKVLGAQVVDVRRARTDSKSKILRTVQVCLQRAQRCCLLGPPPWRSAVLQAHSGTLSDKDLEMLRHSFTLMAGEAPLSTLRRSAGDPASCCLPAAGDDLKAGLLPPQLRELCVMAGLDPAAAATRLLVEALLARKSERTGRISFDAFMKVMLHPC